MNVSSLTLRSDVTTITVEHTHPLLTEGFHRAEETHRWTDGNARIPLEFLACFEDNFIIEVRLLNQGLAYRVACGLPPEPSAGYIPGAVGVS